MTEPTADCRTCGGVGATGDEGEACRTCRGSGIAPDPSDLRAELEAAQRTNDAAIQALANQASHRRGQGTRGTPTRR